MADTKCAALFDQAESSVTTSAGAATVGGATATVEDKGEESEGQEIPVLLQIGRKDSITQEQKATLRRIYARNLERLSWDRYLFFIWVCIANEPITPLGVMINRTNRNSSDSAAHPHSRRHDLPRHAGRCCGDVLPSVCCSQGAGRGACGRRSYF